MSKTRRMLLISGLFFGLQGIASALEPPLWRFWTAADGLRERWTSRITVTPDDSVWINHGSVDEISWLDGYSVETIQNPGIYYDNGNFFYFNTIYEVYPGQVWTNCSEGLKLLADSKWITFSIGLVGSREFIPTGRDRVLVLRSNELLEFNAATGKSGTIRYATQTNLGQFLEIIPARDGNTWITGARGLGKLQRRDGSFGPDCEWSEHVFDDELGVQNLRVPVEGREGEVSGTSESLDNETRIIVHFDGNSWQKVFTIHENERFAAGWLDEYGQQWVIQNDTVCAVTNGKESLVNREQVLAGRIHNVFVEPDGVFWLATTEGVVRYAPPPWRTPLAFAGMQIDEIHLDAEDRIWFTCKESLALLQDDQLSVYPYPGDHIPDFRLNHGVVSLADGRIAISAWPDILLFDPAKKRFKIVKHPGAEDGVVRVYPWKNGKVLVRVNKRIKKYGSPEHLYQFRFDIFDGDNFETFMSRGNEWGIGIAPTPYEAENGDVWIAGLDGVARYRNGQYHIFGPKDGYEGRGALAVLEVEDGKLWFGGQHEIYEFDGDKWKVVRRGLSSIASMVKSRDGSVWAATSSGLFRYLEGSWVENTSDDGLPNVSINQVMEDSQGRIWVTSYTGEVRVYDPEADRNPPITTLNPETPREVSPRGEAQFTFGGKDKWKYTEAYRLLYSHRIDDGEWSPFTTDTVATHAGLQPGPHRFEVRAMDRNWNIDETPAVWEFTVLLAWYREPLFASTIAFLLLIILFLLGFHLRHHFGVEKLVAERTKSLTAANEQLLFHQKKLQVLASELSVAEEQERRRMATDLHDRVGQALALCQMQIQTLRGSSTVPSAEPEWEELHSTIEQTLEATQTLTFEISPPMLYEFGLQSAISWLAAQFQEKYRINIEFRGDEFSDSLSDDLRSFLFRSVRELLINVVKHAQASSVYLFLATTDDQLRIEIVDDGVGADVSSFQRKKPGGFGLFAIQERLKILGGSLDIESASGAGTRVIIKLPIKETTQE